MKDLDNLNDLIERMKNACSARDLSDNYLRNCGCSTRDEIGIGEYAYGITMIPCSWVLPYLKELKEIKEKEK